jgi:hypothetical protein
MMMSRKISSDFRARVLLILNFQFIVLEKPLEPANQRLEPRNTRKSKTEKNERCYTATGNLIGG